MYAEASFEEESTRFRYMILAAAGKLEKGALNFEAGDYELKAYALYFTGLFYCRARYFQKAAERLEECLKFKTPAQVIKSASLLLKSIRTGPLRPPWWKWWLDSEVHGMPKKAGFGIIFLLMLTLLLSHPAVSSLPFVFWPASFMSKIFSFTGAGQVGWAIYGREYIIFILFLLTVLFIPGLKLSKWGNEQLELEMLTPPTPDFEIPSSILEEFTERLEENLFSPEPMEENIQKLVMF